MGLDDVEIVYIARSEGEYFEVRGPRLASLIGREGKTLEALNLIYNNIINAGVRNNRRYYTIDAEGYRARRADQLKTLALATLERVVRENKPIKLEPMLPSERKIVHLALADSPFVRTESEGVEPERRLVVFPKSDVTRLSARTIPNERDASRRSRRRPARARSRSSAAADRTRARSPRASFAAASRCATASRRTARSSTSTAR